MSRFRRFAANVDVNQRQIVAALREIPGVTVQTGHDDIIVGYAGRTYWYEIKSPRAMRKDGTLGLRDRTTTARQIALEAGWRGHYRIVSTVEEILRELFPGAYEGQERPKDATGGVSAGGGQGSGEIARPGGRRALTCGGRASG
jgi:hypothetical protein